MNSIAVDPPFSDTKNKKTSITRDMVVRMEGDIAYLEVTFQSNEGEANSLRTSVTSFVANMSLISETIKEFGK